MLAEPHRTEAVREVLSLLPGFSDEEWAQRFVSEIPELPPPARALLELSLTMRSGLAEILASLPQDVTPDLQQQLLEVGPDR